MTTHDEPDAQASATAPGDDPRAQLEAENEQLRAEADRFRDEMLRARAELDNVRKRAQRDVEAAHKYGVDKLVEALLPVKDSLDLGVEAAANASDVNTLREGMAMTVQLFDTALTRIGVETISATGVKFDPEQHQAMMMEPSANAEAGTVLKVLQKGYRMADRLVRPAMVVVAKAPEGT